MTDSTKFRFHEIEQIPERPGVYAWYYNHEISDLDIKSCQEKLKNSSEDEKLEIVSEFLKKNIFDYYTEQPYQASIAGELKAKYEGKIFHTPQISQSLIKRISEEPDRLCKLKSILQKCVPNFSSPLYIGVAKNLRKRLLNHKEKILKLANTEPDSLNSEDEDEDNRIAHSFALEVCRDRKFQQSNLYVYVIECSLDDKIRYDIENLLNRINYPLCGRK